MNSYRNLASQKIAETLTTLASRIGERFPGSGLLGVCRELIAMAEQTSERADKIARPNIPLIAGVWLLLLLAAGTIVWLLSKATQLEASTELTNVMQGVDAGVSLLIVLGGAAFYLSSLESRWRRRAVLKALARIPLHRPRHRHAPADQGSQRPRRPADELLARSRNDPVRTGALPQLLF